MTDIANIIVTAYSVAGPKPVEPARPRKGATPDEIAAFEQAVTVYDAELAAYDQRVKAIAREITVATAPTSRIYAQVNAIAKALDKDNQGGKVFTGTVVSVTKEQTSQRAIVALYTGTEQGAQGYPQGVEIVRTDRTDNVDGRAIARLAQSLIGHRVTVFIELEEMKNGGRKVRVLRHLESNGKDAQLPEHIVTAMAA